MNANETGRRHVAVVTGAAGAIGTAIARQLAAGADLEVVLVCRDADKAMRCTQEIAQTSGNNRVRYELADLSRRSSVQAMADRWQGPVHVLVNNAAVAPQRRRSTPEGIELQFATNVLGYFWMIQAFTEHLRHASPARIVNVASYWAGGLDIQDVEFERRPYNNNQAYRQSKQADRMLTVAFAKRLQSLGITVNACHPGDVNSTLSNELGFGGHESPEQGARTPVWLATDESVGRLTGKYFERQREVRCPFAADADGVENLFAACEAYGLTGRSATP
ncbi:MAG: SDR family NAD(P)-dependent oxidoreductase [Gammaproteobacteria bacterium]|nr:SDR family NAD(P)-dependent oxidoreductase [Gammaproteobacteria bacterium]